MIKKLNLATPGRGANTIADEVVAEADLQQPPRSGRAGLAPQLQTLIRGLGG